MTRHTHTNDTELAMPRHTSSNRTAPVLLAFGLLATSIACGGEAAEPDAFAELAAGATVPEALAATTPAAPGESELRSYPAVECDDLTGKSLAQVMGLDVPVRMERSGDMCIYRWRPEGRRRLTS